MLHFILRTGTMSEKRKWNEDLKQKKRFRMGKGIFKADECRFWYEIWKFCGNLYLRHQTEGKRKHIYDEGKHYS